MSDYETAREIALRYIDYAPRTTAEVRRRLARAQVTSEVIEAVITALQSAGLLDDARFSREWVESRSGSKRYGRLRLAAELRAKGIPLEQITEALRDIDANSELHAALSLARERLGGTVNPDPATRRRLVAYLQRRGYNFDIIEQVFAQLITNVD